jgi:hypothetical protein
MTHASCNRGNLPDDFFECITTSSALADSSLTYVKFETSEVETYGTGKAYTRVEKIEVELSLQDFLELFMKEFQHYGHHIVAAWFLRSTKLALFRPFEERQDVLTIISDFGEAFLVIGKHETADQFFKRREVNLHGSVCTFLLPVVAEDGGVKHEEVNISVMVSSDIKYNRQSILPLLNVNFAGPKITHLFIVH